MSMRSVALLPGILGLLLSGPLFAQGEARDPAGKAGETSGEDEGEGAGVKGEKEAGPEGQEEEAWEAPPEGADGEREESEEEEDEEDGGILGWIQDRFDESVRRWKEGRTVSLDDEVITPLGQTQKMRETTQSTLLIKDEALSSKGALYLDAALATAPGVEVWSKGWWGAASRLSIRGTYEPHALVVLDGRPLNALWDGIADISWIPLVAAERVELVKGPCSHTWGSGAMGGVVQVRTFEPDERFRYSGGGMYLDHDSFEVRGWNAMKTGPFGWFIGGSLRKTHGFRPNSEFFSDDTFLKLVYDVTPGEFTVKFSAFLHRDGHGVPGPDPDEDTGWVPGVGNERVASLYDDDRQRLYANTVHAIYEVDDRTTFTGIFYYDWRWYRTYTRGPASWTVPWGGHSNFYAYHRNGIWGGSCRFDIEEAEREHKIAVGIDFKALNYHFRNYERPVTLTAVPDPPEVVGQHWHRQSNVFGFWANDIWRAAERLRIVGGVRFDLHNQAFTADAYHLGATLEMDDHTLLRASISRGYRFPSFMELYYERTGVYHPWSEDDPGAEGYENLKPEKIWSFEVGGMAERTIEDIPVIEEMKIFGQIGVFYHFLSDQIDIRPPSGIQQIDNLHRKMVWGLDLHLQAHPSSFLFLDFNYAWYWAYGFHYEAVTAFPYEYDFRWRRSPQVPHSAWRFEAVFNSGIGLRLMYLARYAGARIFWIEDASTPVPSWKRQSLEQSFHHGLYLSYDFFGVATVYAGYEAYPNQAPAQEIDEYYGLSMGEDQDYPIPEEGFNVGVSAGTGF